MINVKVPQVVFRTRVRDESIGGDNPFKWEDKTTEDYFIKDSDLFSLPGAFTRLVQHINYPILKTS